jgi:ABC-2 type transport system permease protein
MKFLASLYVQQFKTTLAMMFQYRASLFIWMIGQVLEPLVYLVVWSVVAAGSGGQVGDYNTAQFAAYFILLMVVNQATYTWIMYEFEYRIREGILSFALLKPVHPIHSDVADNVSSKLITLPVMLLAATGLALFFKASISPAAWSVSVFFPALFLAFLLRFLIEWTLALSAFWTTRVSAVNQTYFVLLLFLSGQIAPLALLPQPVQVIARVLPFYWTIGFPVELMLGQVNVSEAMTGLAAQLAWLGISLVLVRVVWRAGLKVYSAVGS